MDFGTVKNVGEAVIDAIVDERNRNGAYTSFTDFCERIKNESVNKKCIESLIKAGAFDGLGQTRATLLTAFEEILDTINSSRRNTIENQVSMFDIISDKEVLSESSKYIFKEKPELDIKELLSMEKEMLGVYISGHQLNQLKRPTTITINITDLDEETKDKLRGAIRFFSGNRANIKLQIKEGSGIKPCGGLLVTEKVINAFQEIVGKENLIIN